MAIEANGYWIMMLSDLVNSLNRLPGRPYCLAAAALAMFDGAIMLMAGDLLLPDSRPNKWLL
ncbi:Bcr/CflA family drug resistance efflux transporter, partial [Erwinia amylovora]|nr:Bcr/CflA family drug resistance efflux transporter [Erwinia amylovora]